jgi:anti-anti-sigma factor
MKFIRSAGENTIIDLSGKLDFATAGVFMEELRTLVDQGVKRIDIHSKDLEYISSAGIRAMVFMKQKVDKNVEVEVYIHNAIQAVKDVFSMSGLGDYFEFVD